MQEVEMENGLQVVLGAGGGIGGAIVDELVRRKLPVRAVTRRSLAVPDGVENVVAELDSTESARAAVDGAAVVYHAAAPAYHQWLEGFPPLNASVVAATSAVGARLVFADNLYMYGPGAGVMREDTPARATDRKGRLRATMAEKLMVAHAAGELDVVIGRATDYFGPGGVNSSLGRTLFGAAVKGATVRWLGSLDVAHSVVYLPDLAAALVTLGLSPEASGRVWHLPPNGSPTGREFIAQISAAIGSPLKASGTPRWLLRVIGLFRPEVREIADISYQWTAPFVTSDAAFQEAFGPFVPTPLPEAVAQTVAWYQQRDGTGAAKERDRGSG
jgi:nucleoside-diphosphate-sugar epimerase